MHKPCVETSFVPAPVSGCNSPTPTPSRALFPVGKTAGDTRQCMPEGETACLAVVHHSPTTPWPTRFSKTPSCIVHPASWSSPIRGRRRTKQTQKKKEGSRCSAPPAIVLCSGRVILRCRTPRGCWPAVQRSIAVSLPARGVPSSVGFAGPCQIYLTDRCRDGR